MAALLVEESIARAFGGHVFCHIDHLGPASYDLLGRRYVFLHHPDEFQYALDIECHDGAAPMQVTRYLTKLRIEEPPLKAWTEIEVIAKLTNTPAHLLLRRITTAGGISALRTEGIAIRRVDLPGLWLAVGRRPLKSGAI